MSNNVHKDDKPSFWKATKFSALGEENGAPLSLEQYHGKTFNLQFEHAAQTLRSVQAFRRNYLRITSTGTSVPLPEDYISSDDEKLSKNLGRTAAGLRFFIERESEHDVADPPAGHTFILNLLMQSSSTSRWRQELWNRVSALVYRNAGKPLDRDELLLLWEILGERALDAVANAQRAAREGPLWRPALKMGARQNAAEPQSEENFLTLAAGQSIHIGELNLACKLFPPCQWEPTRAIEVFDDDPEAEHQLQVRMMDQRLPYDLLDRLVDEIEAELKQVQMTYEVIDGDQNRLRDVLRRLKDEGSNAYPRLIGAPTIDEVSDINRKMVRVMNVNVGPSRYGIALAEERRLQLPTALRLRSRFILNSLAVRIAYVARENGQWWMEFQKRHPQGNATYRGAWDVGAAGYIDEEAHRDPLDQSRISPWQTAAHELAEELNIARHQLPTRDKFKFFGVGRNDPTGQLDILGYCLGAFLPAADRDRAARVLEYGRCRLTPGDVARFIGERGYWLPTALLTAILTLRHFGFAYEEIEAEFQHLKGRLIMTP
jgi:hypothetical protein